ncbi:hypothetical protein CMUS01_02284 [Colletotrichum musicola]|uniref:Uncharacterized protein n=1 Tax=Colletotrichum musicola TaxID=2175873 RepID=A0A8H6NVB8_9PEZI|nr:hypothetical protein CMUS01_02284 [Colletotrichum musicola]
MHPLRFLLILFASAASALPAVPATPTPAPTTSSEPCSRPPPRPFLPTPTPAAEGADPTPSPIYSTLPIFPLPSNSSSSNASVPCASMRRPLRLGPERFRKSLSPSSLLPPSSTSLPSSPTSLPLPTSDIEIAAAQDTPSDGPRDYASLIPPAPGVTPRPEPNLAEMGYTQTTYYSCVTREASVHCGWHRPIMVAPANNAVSSGTRTSDHLGALVGIVVGLVVVLAG